MFLISGFLLWIGCAFVAGDGLEADTAIFIPDKKFLMLPESEFFTQFFWESEPAQFVQIPDANGAHAQHPFFCITFTTDFIIYSC